MNLINNTHTHSHTHHNNSLEHIAKHWKHNAATTHQQLQEKPSVLSADATLTVEGRAGVRTTEPSLQMGRVAGRRGDI